MARTRVFTAGIELGDDLSEIGAEYGRRTDGTEFALLRLGQATVHIGDTPADILRALAAAALELADWQDQQTAPQIGVAA